MAMREFMVAEATGTMAAPADTATGTGTVAPAPAAEHEVFPPFDSSTFASQLLWLAITFVALYFLLARVAIPRIGGILSDRAGRIARDLETAESAKEQSEAALTAYEKALATARNNANAIAESARAGAKAAADAERSGIEAGLAKKLAAAEQSIAAIKTRALSEVGAIATEATQAIVKALIDADVPKADVDAAVATAMKTGA
jgi:F-type H+-transporting ATPase subunit b